MTTIIKFVAAFFLISAGVNAQVDRTKQPTPGPAPTITLEQPSEFELENGLKTLVVVNKKLPRVTYILNIDNPPITEGKKAGVNSILSAMLGNGTTNIPKDEFNEEVDFLGAQINFGSQSASANTLSKYNERVLELMVDGIKNPLFTEDQFQKEKEKIIEGLKSEEKSVEAAANRVSRALVFGANHPYGEFVTVETVNSVTLDDVRAYYQQNFNPNNAYLVVIGDVDILQTEILVKRHFSDWEKSIGIDVQLPEVNANPPRTEINFVDMPNAVQSNISLTHNVELKMTDADYFPLLIANKILGGGFNSYLNMNLREANAYTYGARSGIGADKYASRFTAGAAVRNAVTDSAVVEIIKEIKRIRETPVSQEDLINAKAKYVGDFVLALEQPSTVASYALQKYTENLPDDYYTTFLEKINAVTSDDVQRVSQKYFRPDNARVVVVGKGSEVLEGLENTGLPVVHFDKYGAITAKTDYSVAIPSGIAVNDVLNKYIEAIGGNEAVNGVRSIVLKAEAELQPGVKMDLVQKRTSSNQFMQEITAMGQSFNKVVINGGTGFSQVQGQKIDMSPEEVKKAITEGLPFPEIEYLKNDLSLAGIENVNGENAYKIQVSAELAVFYDQNTGLKVKEERATPMGVSSTFYSDYKAVDGVMFPFKIDQTFGPQEFNFIVTSIEVNSDVSAADFE